MLNKKDPYLLLSVVNTKLRDESKSLDDLCKTYGNDRDEIVNKLKAVGYKYEESNNQFVAI